jgi:lipopolysaccharide export system protein LptC
MLLVVVGFGLLVVFSAWLQELASRPEPAPGPASRLPDSVLEGYRIDLHNPEGTPRYRVTGPRLSHFKDDASTLLEKPETTVFEAGAAVWRARAGRGLVSADATLITLAEGVVLERLPGAEREALRVATDTLRIEPPRDLAETAAPVRITAPRYQVDAVGMRVRLVGGYRIIDLHSQVRARHAPPGE